MKHIAIIIVTAFLLCGCTKESPEMTAKQYCDTLLNGDFKAFQSLFDTEKQSYILETTFNQIKLTKCEVISASEPYAIIRYRIPLDESWPTETGCLYLLPNGKIKYDPIFVGHPALGLRSFIQQMKADDVRSRQSVFSILKTWSLPLYGFDPDATTDERTDSIAKFQNWVDENEATYDAGKIKIPVSPIDLDRINHTSNQLMDPTSSKAQSSSR